MKTQIAVALVSLASLVVFAANSTTQSRDDVQSFIGTTPNATMAAEQPTTF